MYSHKLTESDNWFIEKGQIDTITRSHFAIGDEVVVCDKKHVSLLECYDAECPVTNCHSKVTVPFNRKNIEFAEISLHTFFGECPNCHEEITILYKQVGDEYSGKCPLCSETITVPSGYFDIQTTIQTLRITFLRLSVAMWCIFVFLIIGIFVLVNLDILNLMPTYKPLLIDISHKNLSLLDKFREFISSDMLVISLKEINHQIVDRTTILCGNAFAVLIVWWNNFKSTVNNVSTKTLDIVCKSTSLNYQVVVRTKDAIYSVLSWFY
jgi:hypothetical protein